MNPTPTGRLVRTPEGRDLQITRTFRASIEDVWASLTESERTARWFGSWSGEPGPGQVIQVRFTHEQGDASAPMTIVACDAPRHLALRSGEELGGWHLEAHLTEWNGVTELRFTQHLSDDVDVGSVGPGWEYYLDNLLAAHEGAPLVDFNDYYPAQQEYFRSQAAELAG